MRNRRVQFYILERGGAWVQGPYAAVDIGPTVHTQILISANVVPERVRDRNDEYNLTQNAG